MDRLIEAISKADWTVLLTIIIALSGFLYMEILRSKRLIARIDDLEKTISEKHKYFGSEVSGKYKNLGEKMSSEHMTIEEDTKSVYSMMLSEKQNREALYENTTHAKEILDTIDIMQEVAQLKLENHQLLRNKRINVSNSYDKLMGALKSFETKLSRFESFNETEEIRAQLKIIENQLIEYKN